MLFITCHSWVLLSFSSSLLLLLAVYFILFLLLNYSYLNPQVLHFFPIVFPTGVGRGQCMVLSRWLGLNHDMVKDGDKTSIKAGAKLEKSRQRQA